MRKNICYIALAFGILTFAGCGKTDTQKEKAPIAVETMKVGESNVNGGQSFSGTIEENEGVTVSFATSGTLKSLNVDEGQTIRKGQLIGVVDATTAQSTYQSSLSALRTAQDSYNRSKMLHDRNSLAEQKWVQAQEQLKQAESMVQITRKSLGDSRLYAPCSGYVSQKMVESGQNVMQGPPVCKIVTIGQVKVKIAVPETEISKIKIGQSVEFTVSALPGRVFHGRISERAITADSQSRSYEVKATVNNSDGALLPGMVCDLNLNYVKGESAIFLHADVVQLDSDNRYFVWTVVGGKAHKTYITTGEETSQGVMITGGLNQGDEVIVKGQQKVSEGNKVWNK